MRTTFILIIMMVASASFGQQVDLKGKSVLIYTRNGEGYVHDNIAASVEALEKICSSLGIKTESTNDPAVFESKKLKKFDAIIFSNTNNEAFLNEQQRENFQNFIRSGKGFMGVHSANASERNWPWYRQMVGGSFVRHPALQPFDIIIIDKHHISTAHLPEVWKWEDECYYSDYLNPAINVLFAADLTTINDDKKSEYPGQVFGDLFPLAWYHHFEGSRVFYTALGHKIEYYQDKNFIEHLKGGIVWVLE